ncbi:unnamed protein product [Mytilus edulis]|uniref:Uncharacterized protein n=1 Tax=Mytilus edulis TaxID=6550 RepID=A0A8S3VNV6_MYTED|nr:unnamed protein product [Mytilus edulis]
MGMAYDVCIIFKQSKTSLNQNLNVKQFPFSLPPKTSTYRMGMAYDVCIIQSNLIKPESKLNISLSSLRQAHTEWGWLMIQTSLNPESKLNVSLFLLKTSTYRIEMAYDVCIIQSNLIKPESKPKRFPFLLKTSTYRMGMAYDVCIIQSNLIKPESKLNVSLVLLKEQAHTEWGWLMMFVLYSQTSLNQNF